MDFDQPGSAEEISRSNIYSRRPQTPMHRPATNFSSSSDDDDNEFSSLKEFSSEEGSSANDHNLWNTADQQPSKQVIPSNKRRYLEYEDLVCRLSSIDSHPDTTARPHRSCCSANIGGNDSDIEEKKTL